MPALHLAAQTLELMRSETPDPASKPVLARELALVEGELRACTRLIAQGLALTQGVARLLAPASSSYRQDGEPVPLPADATVLVRG